MDLPGAKARLLDCADSALQQARKLGASAAVVEASESVGLSVSVRMGEVETLEHEQDRGIGITVYAGQSRGSASTTDFSPAALQSAVAAAWGIASHTAADEFSGLPDAERLATQFPDLDTYHPWELEPDVAIALATTCEQAALDVDARITNSEGASVGTRAGVKLLANSLGFRGFSEGASHSLSLSLIHI